GPAALAETIAVAVGELPAERDPTSGPREQRVELDRGVAQAFELGGHREPFALEALEQRARLGEVVGEPRVLGDRLEGGAAPGHRWRRGNACWGSSAHRLIQLVQELAAHDLDARWVEL